MIDRYDRKEALRELRQSESKFRSLFNLAAIPLAYFDNTGVLLDINEKFTQIFGYAKADISTLEQWWVLAFPELGYRRWVIDTWKTAAKKAHKEIKHIESVNCQVICKNGDVRDVIISSSSLDNHILIAFVDITDLKRAQEAENRSNTLYREIMKQSGEGISLADTEGNYVSVNPAFCSMTGYSEADLLEMNVQDLVTKETKPILVPKAAGGKQGSRNLELVRKNGSRFMAEVHGYPLELENHRFVLGTIRDITKRELTERLLQESEERFSLAMQGANDGLWDWNLETGTVFYSPRWKSMLGYTENEVEPTLDAWKALVHPDDLPQALDAIEQYLTGTTDRYVVEFRMCHKEGHYVDILSRASAFRRDSDDKPIRLIGTHVDLTKRKQAEVALRESELLLRTVAQNFPHSYISVIYKDFTIGFTSGQGYTKQGTDPSTFIGLPIDEVMGVSDSGLLKILKGNFLKTFKGQETEFEIKLEGKHHLYKSVPLPDEKDQINKILVVVEDITDRKLAEERVKASLKEKEVLLKEIHHRVKNNLAVISSLLNLQAKRSRSGSVRDAMRDSQARVRAMALIHETLYQQEDLAMVPFEAYARKLIRGLRFVYEDAVNEVSVVFDIEDIYLDISRSVSLGLILNELVTNCLKYAFPNEQTGEIRIFARLVDDARMELRLKDDGAGLPPGFDYAHSDTLGLRIVSLMVDQLQGTWEMCNEEGLEVRMICRIC